jgi:hypothetical protein
MWHKVFKIVKWISLSVIALAITLTLLLLVFRKDIQRYALQQLDQYLTTKVYVYDMDVKFWATFPQLSIEFKHVLIKDEMIVEGTIPDTLFYAEKLNFRLNTKDFWKGDYTVQSIDIQNSRLGLRIAQDGKVNYSIFKTDTSSAPSSFNFVLEKVAIAGLDFSYDNFITEQHYRTQTKQLDFKGNFSDVNYDLETTGDLFINQIRSKSVSLITNKQALIDVVISVDQVNDVFLLDESLIQIENLPFLLSCRIVKDTLDFNLSANKINLTDFANNFNQTAIDDIRKFKGKGEVDFTLSIAGVLEVDKQPLIESSFQIRNGSLKDPSSALELKKISIKGSYTNNYGNNEQLNLEELHFVSLNSDFHGKMRVSQFDRPEISATMNGSIDLATIHRFFPFPAIHSIDGLLNTNASVRLQFNNPKSDPSNVTIFHSKGDFVLKNINVQLDGDVPFIEKMSGKVSVLRDNALFDHLSLTIGKSSLSLTGSVKNVLNYFSERSSLIVDALIESNALYSTDFYSNDETSVTTSNVGAYILPTNINGKVLLSINQLHLDDHVFENIESKFTIQNRKYDSDVLQFSHIGVSTKGAIAIEEKRPGKLDVSGSLVAKQIDFSKLFKEWNDFEQTMILHNQISGKADIQLHFYLPYSFQHGLQKELLKASTAFTISNGGLQNVETLKLITESMRENKVIKTVLGENIDLLEKRLLDLKFQTLENTIEIADSKITLPKMKIKSNALEMDISGWQTFDNDIDYHFEFRLRDLKFKQKTSEFGEIIDDETGQRIFLHIYGNIDDIQFSWDKAASKERQRELIKEEKETVKSILKTELGLFKKDTTIQQYKPVEKPKERIEIIIGNDETNDDLPKERKKLKKILGMDLEKMREESKKEPELEFSVDN